MKGYSNRRELVGYLYIIPWIIGFAIFILGPMIYSLYLSLTDYQLIIPPSFVGGDNYVAALKDTLFWKSLQVTGYFMLLAVPGGIIGSLFAALLLNELIFTKATFRLLFFLPSLTPMVATIVIWSWMFQPEFGLINNILGRWNIEGPLWLSSSRWAVPSLFIITLWYMGGQRCIIFLAALQGVPRSLYEVAEIDGARRWDKFWNITLPMISPALFFNFVMAIIMSFQMFTLAFVATSGGMGTPANSTLFYIIYIYHNAFSFFKMGYASALAWLLMAILLGFTYWQFRLSRKWVYYAE